MAERTGQDGSGRLHAFVAFVVVVGAGLSVLAWWSVDQLADQPFAFHWAVLGGAFIVAEWFAVNLEVRREAHVLTFTEVPLTLGLIFAAPGDFLIARVVASTLAVWVIRRSPFLKMAFNAGLFALDASIALLVFHAILGSETPVEPIGWIAALTAVAVSHLICAAAVTLVMRFAGAPVTVRSQFLVVTVSFGSAMAGTAVALGASGALWRDGRYWILLVIIGAALGYFFIAFLRIKERHLSLSALHDYTSIFVDVDPSRSLLESVAAGMAELLKANRVVLLVPNSGSFVLVEYAGGDVEIDSDYRMADVDWIGAIEARGSLSSGTRRSFAGIDLSSGSAITARLPLPEQTGLVIVDDRLSASRQFDDEDVQLLETAAGHAAAALQNSRLLEQLRDEARVRAHQALHDDVTDLPNQRSLVESLAERLAGGAHLAVLTVRIHSLREVNETLGRAMGDEMLRQVARRLSRIGEASWCARSGTDEFTLVVPGAQHEADLIAASIVDSFAQPVLCDEVALAVTVGIGIVLAPTHASEGEILVRRASLAASRSALDGTTVTTWASDRDPYDPQRLTIAADLRDAIPNGELEVHFQPQLDIETNLVTGAEALVRWRHPRLGQLGPDQFIPAAENTGAIDALTFHVLTVAAEATTRWRAIGWDLDIAVNLSARNLTNPDFAAEVASILDVTGLPAGSLTMELTESSVMTEAERALTTLYELHELGIGLSIDDFGTGYSSLAHLRRLPVGEIKVDKSFILDLMTNDSDEAIVRSMIDLGHNLGLTVVAEGVETVEVREHLRSLGSDRMQGYLLSRPLTSSAFEHWLTERRTRVLHPDTTEAQVVNLETRR